jgi:hypothetical protein
MAIFPFLDPRKRLLEDALATPTYKTPPLVGEGGGPMALGETGAPALPNLPSRRPLLNPAPPPDVPMTGPSRNPWSELPDVVGGENPVSLSDAARPGYSRLAPISTPNMTGPGPAIEPLTAPTQYERLQAEKEGYLRGTPGRKRSALLGALTGALQGLGSGQGLGGALGGALAGGIYGGAAPRQIRERQFETRERPKILEKFAFEDAEKARQAAAAKAAMDGGMTQAQLANIQSQIDSRRAQDVLNQQKANQEADKPIMAAPSATVLTRGQNGGYSPVFTAPAKPTPEKAPTAAELGVDPDDGSSVEEKARASYEARGGDQYVYDRLPERTRQVLEDDKNTYSPAQVASAERAYQNAINRQWQSDLSYTKGAIRSKVLGKRQGGGQPRSAPRSPATPRQSNGQSRNLKDLTNLWK